MSPRKAATLAWSLWAAAMALQLMTVWQIAEGHGSSDELFGLVTIGFVTVGGLIASRRPGNAVGWLLLAISLAFGVQQLGEVYAVESNPGHQLVAWLASVSWFVWMTLVVVFLPLLFPDGRVLSRRWRSVAWLGCTALVMSMLGAAVKPGPLDIGDETIQNPLGITGPMGRVFEGVGRTGGILIAVAFVLSATSLALRFRRARGAERQQLKWFSYFCVVTLGGVVVAMIQVIFPGGWRDPVGGVGWFTFLFGGLLGIPIGTGIAILRHRLYDIDVVINRTLVYAALTATLVATYLGTVLLFRLLLSPLTGDSNLAVAGSTLAVAAAFRPARTRIQHAVDRRFYRARYDAARTLEGFATRLRNELDVDALGADLRRVVFETMAPAHVSLWLRGA